MLNEVAISQNPAFLEAISQPKLKKYKTINSKSKWGEQVKKHKN